MNNQYHGVLALVVISFLAAARLSAQTLEDLGDFGGGFSIAYGINSSGQVVGGATNASGNEVAFLYSNGQMTSLGTLGGYTSGGNYIYQIVASAISSSGEVVGQSTTTSGESVAFLYANGSMTNIGAGNGSEATSVNDSGQITGNGPNYLPFLYSNGVVKTFGATYDGAEGINASGEVVGFSKNGVLIYKNGVVSNLGTLGPPVSGLSTAGRAVNDSGEVVGGSNGQAFVSSGNQMTGLGTLSGQVDEYHTSGASGINTQGQVVGASTSDGTEDAFLYSPGTGMVDLNLVYSSLLVTGTTSQAGFKSLSEASGINDRGQIVGYGTYWNGSTQEVQAFLLSPESVPEPFSYTAILCPALGLLAGLRSRLEMRKH